MHSITRFRGRPARLLAALLACLGLAAPAMAAETALPVPAAPATPSALISADPALWNPRPDKVPSRDIVMPMPGGMAMVFRVVAVPTRGLLWSMELDLGVSDLGVSDAPQAGRALQDGTWRTLLSAPFMVEDTLKTTTALGTVPVAWKDSLPGDGSGGWSCYLIAKYEVTRGQYRSVMESGAAPRDDDNMPVTYVGWLDVMALTERWTAWLLENHPDALPSFKGDTPNTGYVRLPTEAEWEYAARGGQNESINYSQQTFFTMAEGTDHADYAVMDGAPLAPIGTRLPNPLGLHDTAGNAAEMTLDTFRYSRSGTLQGPSGGFVCRGGSHLSDKDAILPGRREEMPLFTARGESRSESLGFRPVISGINVPSQDRRLALVAAYDAMSGQSSAKQSFAQEAARAETGTTPMIMFGEPAAAPAKRQARATPMEELNDLILSESDPVLRGHLIGLRARLSESNILQTLDRAARARNHVQQCIMTLEIVRNIWHKSFILRDMEMPAINAMVSQDGPAQEKKYWKDKKKATEKNLRINDKLLDKTIASYISDMHELLGMHHDDVRGAFQYLAALYRGEDRFNYRMTRTMGMVRGHYERMTTGVTLDARDVLKDLEDMAEREAEREKRETRAVLEELNKGG